MLAFKIGNLVSWVERVMVTYQIHGYMPLSIINEGGSRESQEGMVVQEEETIHREGRMMVMGCLEGAETLIIFWLPPMHPEGVER